MLNSRNTLIYTFCVRVCIFFCQIVSLFIYDKPNLLDVKTTYDCLIKIILISLDKVACKLQVILHMFSCHWTVRLTHFLFSFWFVAENNVSVVKNNIKFKLLIEYSATFRCKLKCKTTWLCLMSLYYSLCLLLLYAMIVNKVRCF